MCILRLSLLILAIVALHTEASVRVEVVKTKVGCNRKIFLSLKFSIAPTNNRAVVWPSFDKLHPLSGLG